MQDQTPTPSSPTADWNPQSWRNFEALQQPAWPDLGALDAVTKEITNLPPLIFAGEARALTKRLGAVSEGSAFLLQAGDCAESFDGFNAISIREKLRVILQMAVVLTYSGGMPIVKVGRIAGQFAKPRSNPTETKDGAELPSFLGHMVNDVDFTESNRLPDPSRLVQAYNQSASTLNLLRAFSQGGFADLNRVQAWNQEFVANSPQSQRYKELAEEISRALRFMEIAGIGSDHAEVRETEFYTSHEALILQYEEALTRQDSLTGDYYDCSAHMVWIGERTRQLDGAHLEYMRGIHNPIGCKVGPTANPTEVVELCDKLNPNNTPGRLTLITRMGAKVVDEKLPAIVDAVESAGKKVVWACDPMHGNTYTEAGKKTRHFDDVFAEVCSFFNVHRKLGSWPGGIHVELTGENVTECLGGAAEIVPEDLDKRYETMCDPRLNANQSLDLAFSVAELLSQ